MAKKKEFFSEEEIENTSLAIVSGFSLIELKMKNDLRWTLKILVHEIMPKAHHDYSIKFEFDEEPYQDNIDQLEQDISDLSDNPTMFPDVDKKTVNDIQTRIEKIKKEMEKMRNDCPDISFVAQTEEVKYKGNDTVLVVRILDTVIDPINEHRFKFSHYRAVLDPKFGN